MKYKEITPGMIIYPENKQQTRQLMKELHRLGYRKTDRSPIIDEDGICTVEHSPDLCYLIMNDSSGWQSRYVTVGTLSIYEKMYKDRQIIRFPDLVLPEENPEGDGNAGIECEIAVNSIENLSENSIPAANSTGNSTDSADKEVTPHVMSAVEFLQWLHDNCDLPEVKDRFRSVLPPVIFSKSFKPEDVVRRVEEYKEKMQNPEDMHTEWVEVCRIVSIHKNGNKTIVYEEELPEPAGADNNRNKMRAEEILKNYAAHHAGEFFATIAENCVICKK